jgi:regulation of enolase protein 1 (concanavalin A-like superfamily)
MSQHEFPNNPKTRAYLPAPYSKLQNPLLMRPIITLMFIVLCSWATFGQGQEPASQSDFNLFGESTAEAAEKKYKEVTEGTLLSIDLTKLQALRESAPDQFSLAIPLKDNKSLKLKLEKMQVFTNDFKVETSRRSHVPDLDLGVHYKGTLSGHSPSLVTLSIYKDELVGLISDGKHDYELVKIKDEASRYIIYKTVDIAEQLKDKLFRFQCHTESSGKDLPQYTHDQLFGTNRSHSDCKVIQVYLVGDFDFYEDNGSDVGAATNRLTSVFAQTINIYDAESIYMILSGIFIWEDPDTFGATDAADQRDNFRDYYNSTGAGWPGDLAQLIAGAGGSGAGGIAYFDGLCTSDSYALTRVGISAPIADWTMYSRFVKVLTHEIGHNLDSRHTHACVWNGDNTQIDDYGNISVSTMMPVTDDEGNPNPEGGACLSEPYILDATPRIMSYFDSNGWGQFNMTNGMGTQSGNVMRNYVDNSSCLTDGSNVDPIALCQDVTIQLNSSGDASTTASAIDDGSYEACRGIPSLSLNQTSFDCSDTGNNTVTLTVTDHNGNSSTCDATVTVEDNIDPTAVCQNITVQLDASGNGATTASAANNGSFDNCSISSTSLSQSSFGCSELGINFESLTVTDPSGNTDACSTIITVEDNINPTAVCQNVTVQLDANGNASTTANAVNDGSFDNCSVSSISLSQSSFVCSELGDNTEMLTVTDQSGNTDFCMATVTVEDNIPPVAFCLNTTVEIQPDGTYSLQESDVFDAVNSFDNCDITQVNFPATTYTCDDVYQSFPVGLTISDAAGNTDDCTANIYVEIGTALPPQWSTADIGMNAFGNAYSFDPCTAPNPEDGEFTITGSGNNGFNPTQDAIAFAHQNVCGDFTLTAKMESVDPNGYGGLMARESTAPGAKQYSLFSNLSNTLLVQIRTVTNGPKQQQLHSRPYPIWLRLQRMGPWLIGYYSQDGINFQYVQAAFLPLNTCLEVGLATFTSYGSPATAVFSYVDLAGGAPLVNGGQLPAFIQQEMVQAELFPNPTKDAFTLAFPQALNSEATATLRNQIGQVVEQRQLKPGDVTTEWKVNELPAGLYFMEVRQAGNKPQVLRVVKAN